MEYLCVRMCRLYNITGKVKCLTVYLVSGCARTHTHTHVILFALLQMGNCKKLTVVSLRDNELMSLPNEIGLLQNLTVLNLVGNKYVHIKAPSFVKCTHKMQ